MAKVEKHVSEDLQVLCEEKLVWWG